MNKESAQIIADAIIQVGRNIDISLGLIFFAIIFNGCLST